ncbi:hypothetical protein A3F08_02790 [Candidatus Berkelbacteria bacterium RIFCSPHIGHO2_12_FULL_36_9]|uniref:Uncharacterized protein n=1 Tax=Candidatus Berkelbacteria bacterium RIFCSPHIGHO2_12_FULL_36_9 TaxID=1797469 RepID=A0A1F5EDQ5_9BACT|nr:MAG: hypothetical protein A3F08_02790 [Candidatus Berkelbacteria bacterium RIFCSPHIGHO2_12_FULL_36_9]
MAIKEIFFLSFWISSAFIGGYVLCPILSNIGIQLNNQVETNILSLPLANYIYLIICVFAFVVWSISTFLCSFNLTAKLFKK